MCTLPPRVPPFFTRLATPSPPPTFHPIRKRTLANNRTMNKTSHYSSHGACHTECEWRPGFVSNCFLTVFFVVVSGCVCVYVCACIEASECARGIRNIHLNVRAFRALLRSLVISKNVCACGRIFFPLITTWQSFHQYIIFSPHTITHTHTHAHTSEYDYGAGAAGAHNAMELYMDANVLCTGWYTVY